MVEHDVAFRFIVSGKVQGVYFRASAAREAHRLGLRGRAVNRPDGSVEVLAMGPAAAVEDLRRWLHRGPPAARVDAVESIAEDAAAFTDCDGFRTG